MGMTMTEKILAKHAGIDVVKPGQLINCKLDMVLANDVTAPPAIKEFEKIGKPVFDNTKIALVPDHFTPNKDIKSAGLAKIVRDFAHKYNIVNYFEIGRVGIEHNFTRKRYCSSWYGNYWCRFSYLYIWCLRWIFHRCWFYRFRRCPCYW